MSDKYLDDDELAMLAGLFRDSANRTDVPLMIAMDASLRALLEKASALELRMELNNQVLHFPVQLPAQLNEAQLTAPLITSDGLHPRAWRLPPPEGLSLVYRNGKRVAADIQDLSVNGMRLLSRRCLFAHRTTRNVLMKLNTELTIPLSMTLVRQHRGNQFWLTSVTFELAVAERLVLSEFVFRGFIRELNKTTKQPDEAAS